MPSNSPKRPDDWDRSIVKKHEKPRMPLFVLQAKLRCLLLKYALMRDRSAPDVEISDKTIKKKWSNEKNATIDWIKHAVDSRRDEISLTLEQMDKNLAQRAIVWDFKTSIVKEWWKDKLLARFKTEYWLTVQLDATLTDLNRFLDYCVIHSFIPMFDRIIINGEDILKIPGIYTILYSKISSHNWTILNSLYNELDREYESRPDIKPAFETILPWINKFLECRDSIYQNLFGERLAKIKQTGINSERIFSEAATSIDNEIINKIWISSTGCKPCTYEQDHGKELDLCYKMKREKSHHNIREIWIQLTMMSDNSKLSQKEKKVEGYLHTRPISDIDYSNIDYKDSTDRHNFILLSVNWEFENQSQKINELYKEWRSSPLEREKYWKIPYFVDTLDPELIKPAEVVYIALNMLYKKINFKFSNNDGYLRACKTKWIIFGKNQEEINWIKLNKISIDSAEVTKLKYTWGHSKWHDLLKHKYTISYDWEKMWTIVVYWM